MELGLSLRRCNEEKEALPNYLVIGRFSLSGAATVGQWLHSDHLLDRLHVRSSTSRRNLDPGADFIARRKICVDRCPSLVALMFSNAARLFH
jgi:hypothetical protein